MGPSGKPGRPRHDLCLMAEMRVLRFLSPSHIYYLPPQLLLSAAPVFVPSGINATARGGVLIKISESSYTIGDDGRLVIPADDLTEMGLTAGQDVFVAYVTDDGLANRYHEFTVSSVSLSELDTTQQIAIPQQLLEQAGIDSNAEVQIACIDGAIIITGDTPLTEDELSEVVGRLRAVNDLTEHFPSELDTEEGGTGYGRF